MRLSVRTRTVFVAAALCATALIPAPSLAAHLPPGEGLGRVHMQVSCAPRVQADFDRGLALLYSFWYDRALTVFDRVIKSDPQCRMAYWGAAMTFNHPLWAAPTGMALRAGLRYLNKGAPARERSPEEAAYFSAAQTLFGDAIPAHKQVRDERYSHQMSVLYRKYPNDNAALFYALAIEGTYRYSTTPQKIELAGRLAEGVRAHQPMHPGALHYIIHAYDSAGYEERALSAAREYAASAPAIPHALHMPSHTFVALGLWSESNATNEHAWKAENVAVPDLHTLWFLTYGYLQVGRYPESKSLAIAALGQYRSFVKLYPTVSNDVAEEQYNMMESLTPILTYAVQTGDYSADVPVSADGLNPTVIAARMQYQVLQALGANHFSAAKTLCDQLDAFAASAPAGLAGSRIAALPQITKMTRAMYDLRSGHANAMEELAAAADQESHLSSALVPLLFFLPAHETYGRELFLQGDYAKAETELKAAVERYPNRTRALYWLQKAAAKNNDMTTAAQAKSQFERLWTGPTSAANAAF